MSKRKRLFIWFWPLALLPFCVLLTWPTVGWYMEKATGFGLSSFSLSQAWTCCVGFLRDAPVSYTALCGVLLVSACLWWLRRPSYCSFFASAFVGCGLLGMPGAYLVFLFTFTGVCQS
jgi:hypothetical protein